MGAIASGQAGAADELFDRVYDEIRRIASAQMAQERQSHTLQATALANEAYLRLLKSESPIWEDRRYFFASVGRAMRRILIEHARKHRGHATLHSDTDLLSKGEEESTPDWEAIDAAIRELEREDERLADVVHLRYFAGLSRADTAAALGVSEATVKRDWAYARARLSQILSE